MNCSNFTVALHDATLLDFHCRVARRLFVAGDLHVLVECRQDGRHLLEMHHFQLPLLLYDGKADGIQAETPANGSICHVTAMVVYICVVGERRD